jgi:hypothetical protein
MKTKEGACSDQWKAYNDHLDYLIKRQERRDLERAFKNQCGPNLALVCINRSVGDCMEDDGSTSLGCRCACQDPHETLRELNRALGGY